MAKQAPVHIVWAISSPHSQVWLMNFRQFHIRKTATLLLKEPKLNLIVSAIRTRDVLLGQSEPNI